MKESELFIRAILDRIQEVYNRNVDRYDCPPDERNNLFELNEDKLLDDTIWDILENPPNNLFEFVDDLPADQYNPEYIWTFCLPEEKLLMELDSLLDYLTESAREAWYQSLGRYSFRR